jgi:hypothetical protein
MGSIPLAPTNISQQKQRPQPITVWGLLLFKVRTYAELGALIRGLFGDRPPQEGERGWFPLSSPFHDHRVGVVMASGPGV